MNIIYRSSTPTFDFYLPIKVTEIDKLQITMAQDGVIKLQKAKGDCTLSNQKVSLVLTRDETLGFKEGQLDIQIIVVSGDKQIPSKLMFVEVKEILSNGIVEVGA